MKILLVFSLLCFSRLAISQTSFIQWSDFDAFRNLPSYAGELSKDVCQKEFPINRVIKQNLDNSRQDRSFNLFSYMTVPFDVNKKSMIVIHGGPGGLWNASSSIRIATTFLKYNVIFFHYRGGGCSSFTTRDPEFDKYISSVETLKDLEAIRKSYNVKKWHAVLGYSYGTNIAILYGNKFSTNLDNLILEGLDLKNTRKHEKIQTRSAEEKVLETVRNQYQTSELIQRLISKPEYDKFYLSFSTYLLNYVDVQYNYLCLGFSEKCKQYYQQSFQNIGLNLPDYFNSSTFAAVTRLVYSNVGKDSEWLVLSLLEQFAKIQLPQEIMKDISSNLQKVMFGFYPFLNTEYESNFTKNEIVSSRVQKAMNISDVTILPQDFCTSVNTLVLNGTQDSATPVENVDLYLSNKSCASAKKNQALIVAGGGHSNLNSMECLGQYANQFLEGDEKSDLLQICKMPVQLKIY